MPTSSGITRTLILMRHAESPMSGDTDFDRVLSANGRDQAALIGAQVFNAGLMMDAVLCSPAARTRETLDYLGMGNTPQERIMFPQSLYNASSGEIIHMIQKMDDDVQCLFVMAHNPGIFGAVQFVWNRKATAATDALMMGYPPASCAVLQMELDHWHNLAPNSGTMSDLFMPDMMPDFKAM